MATASGADGAPDGWPFKPPRNSREIERTRILGARLLVRQAHILGHDIDDDIVRVAERPLPRR